MAMCWLGLRGVWLRLAGRSGRSRGSRRLVMLIFGGWVTPRPLFVARPLSKVERGRVGGRVLAAIAELACASRGCSGRLASRNGDVE